MKSFLSSLVDRIFGKKEEDKDPNIEKLEALPEPEKITPKEEPILENPLLEPAILDEKIPEIDIPEPLKPIAEPKVTNRLPPLVAPAKPSPTKPTAPPPNPIEKTPIINKPSPKLDLPSSISFTNPNFSKLADQDYKDAAKTLNCEEAVIRAVVEVESSGGGFLASNRAKILFEAHLFARATKNIYNKSHPEISSQVWNKQLYKGGEKEYDRLAIALSLNEEAALASCSYGMFQILASNFKSCGFSSVKEFVEAQVKGEKEQLVSFINFVRTNKLDKYLEALNFPLFAKMYNGPSYQSNKYDIKLQNSYEKWKQKLNK